MVLAFEAAVSVLWIARLVSVAAAYDTIVYLILAMRALVATLQFTSAGMLARSAPPAVAFASIAVLASAALMVAEVGFGLAPSSIPSWLRIQVVIGYAVYAAICLGLLTILARAIVRDTRH